MNKLFIYRSVNRSNTVLANLPNCGKTSKILIATTYKWKHIIILNPVMEALRIVKTLIKDIIRNEAPKY